MSARVRVGNKISIMQDPALCGVSEMHRQFIRDNCQNEVYGTEEEQHNKINPRSADFKKHRYYAAYDKWLSTARIQYTCFIESSDRVFREPSFKQFLRIIKFCTDDVVQKLIELYTELRKPNRIYEHFANKKWHVSTNLTHFLFIKV